MEPQINEIHGSFIAKNSRINIYAGNISYMITPIVIPKLTLTMEGGNLVKWLKHEGDRVEKDELLFELETDKAVTEVPSPATGILRKIVLQEGNVEVEAVVGFIGELTDPIPETSPGPGSQLMPSAAPTARPIGERPKPLKRGLVRATPSARRLARELAVDISLIRGTGPEGRITQEDVEQAASGLPVTASDFRHVIAERMSNSWQRVPHIHVGGELEATGLKNALDKAKREIGPEISMTDLLLLAVAKLLTRFPVLNTVWEGSRARVQRDVNLAFAVRTDRGVLAPVLRNAHRHSLRELSAERRRLAEAAITRRLKPSEVEGGTFTLTNLGMYPVDFFAPIINFPQAAILATGRLRNQMEPRDGLTTTVRRMWVNLALDHRVADGAMAAEFLRDLEKLLESLEEQI